MFDDMQYLSYMKIQLVTAFIKFYTLKHFDFDYCYFQSSCSTNNALLNNPFLASFASSLSPSEHGGPTSICRDPLCRDPLCPTAIRNQQHLNFSTYSSLMASAPYYKEAMMALTQQRMAIALASSAAAAGSNSGPTAAPPTMPHVCNWVSGTFIVFVICEINTLTI